MPYQAVKFINKPLKEARASIGYERHYKTRRTSTPRLVVGIPAVLANGFKPKDADLFGLQIGDGKDAGKARIVKVTGGGVTARKLRGGALVFRFGFIPMLGDNAAAKEFIDGKAIDGGFELALPAWFKADDA